MNVAVIKIGVGNTASVMFALERQGAAARLTADPAEILDAERVILPGVGAAGYAMARIDAAGLRPALLRFRRPLLAVCLGQQLLFDKSEEGDAACLGLVPGTVRKLDGGAELPVPHMAWSRLGNLRANPLLDGVRNGDYCYFAHSYACPVNDFTLAIGAYGTEFAAIVARGNVFGCQFHPERSAAVGERILANFLALPC